MEHIEHTGCIDQPYQFVGQLGYYTHVQDANLPLLQLGVRFYDPQVGRFGQRDPLLIPASRYAYCQDKPLIFSDPTGCKPITEKLLGDGQICVHSSCHGKNYLPTGIKNIPNFDTLDQLEPLPETPERGRIWCFTWGRVNCAKSDGIYVPPSTDFDLSGIPQRPPGATILKIRDGWTCTFTCNDKSRSNKVTLSCYPRSILVMPWPPFWPEPEKRKELK